MSAERLDVGSLEWALAFCSRLDAARDDQFTARIVGHAVDSGIVSSQWSGLAFAHLLRTRGGPGATLPVVEAQELRWIEAAFARDEVCGLQHATVLFACAVADIEPALAARILRMGDPSRPVPAPPGVSLHGAAIGLTAHGLSTLTIIGAIAEAGATKLLAALGRGANGDDKGLGLATVPIAGRIAGPRGERDIDLIEMGDLLGRELVSVTIRLLDLDRDCARRSLGACAQALLDRPDSHPLCGAAVSRLLRMLAAGAELPDGNWHAWMSREVLEIPEGERHPRISNVALAYVEAWRGGRGAHPVELAIVRAGMNADMGAAPGVLTPLHIAADRCDAGLVDRLLRAGADPDRLACVDLAGSRTRIRAAGLEVERKPGMSMTAAELAQDGPAMNESARAATVAVFNAARAARDLRSALDQPRSSPHATP